MSLKKLSTGAIITGILLSLLAFFTAKTAWAETYSFTNEIVGQPFIFGPLAGPTDVSVGPGGDIFIADSSNFGVVRLDEFNNFQRVCFFSNNLLPLAVDVDDSGNVYYVTRFNGAISDVIKFSSLGSCNFSNVGSAGQFAAPFGIAVGPDGNVYVADTDNDMIRKFGPDGNFLTSWGATGNGPGEFHGPRGIDVSGNNLVFVTDAGNHRVQLFDANGTFLGEGGSQGTGVGQFESPGGIALGPDGSLFISDTGNNRILKFAPDGTFLFIGGDVLSSPQGIDVDKGGNVYVADTFNDRIAVFTPDIVKLEKGAQSKTIGIPSPIDVTLDIQPDLYWNNAPAEFFAWVEVLSLRAYYGGPNIWVPFTNFSNMVPVVSGIGIFPINDFPVRLIDSTAGFPALTLEFFVCIDREINGVYDPSASICDSVSITLQ